MAPGRAHGRPAVAFFAMDAVVKTISPRTSQAQNLMEEQVKSGLRASQQYLACAVWFDQRDLPRLASYFYRQSPRKRDHAMRIVQYMIDNSVAVEVPSVEAVRNDFSDPRKLIALAVEQERVATDEVTTLSRVLREEGDYLGEQFVRWFLSEQVDEIAQMNTMLNVADRSQGNNVRPGGLPQAGIRGEREVRIGSPSGRGREVAMTSRAPRGAGSGGGSCGEHQCVVAHRAWRGASGLRGTWSVSASAK